MYGVGPFAVTAVAGINGSVAPNSPHVVNNGESITYCGDGIVDKWFVNNAVAQSGGNTFTLRNVADNMTILVTFEPLPDLNGDGLSDILLEDATGEIGWWSMHGEVLEGEGIFLAPKTLAPLGG